MVVQKIIHLFIELDDGTIYRKVLRPIFDGKNPWVSCRFSLKPTQWFIDWDFPMETIQRTVVLIRGIHPTVLEMSGDEHPTTSKHPENWCSKKNDRNAPENHLLLINNIPTHTFQWHESFTTLTKPRWSRYGPGRHKSLRTSGEGGRYVRVLRLAQGCHQNGDHIPGFVKPDQSIYVERSESFHVFPTYPTVSSNSRFYH